MSLESTTAADEFGGGSHVEPQLDQKCVWCGVQPRRWSLYETPEVRPCPRVQGVPCVRQPGVEVSVDALRVGIPSPR